METIKHNCGVAGIYSKSDVNIPERLFYPLFALQHRGQESCGIAYERNGAHVTYKDLGMVGQVLARYLGERHLAKAGIGHVRYSTQGSNTIENSQPIAIVCNKGNISLVHNGTISNSPVLRTELFGNGSIFQGTTDPELILHLIARSKQTAFPSALTDSLRRLEGAFNLIMMHDDSLVRGTTAKIIVSLLRENGAKEIHLRLSAPELRHPCYFGIDIPTRDELISANMPPDEVARHIGADSVGFLRLESLRECVSEPDNFCYACFSGQYPVEAKGWNRHGN